MHPAPRPPFHRQLYSTSLDTSLLRITSISLMAVLPISGRAPGSKTRKNARYASNLFCFVLCISLTNIAKVVVKVVRVNNESENGHEKMNKVRKSLTIIPQSTSYFATETGERGLSMAQAGSRKRSASIGHYARLRTRQPYRHGLPLARKWQPQRLSGATPDGSFIAR